MTRMYENTATWNLHVGCEFDCTYCRPSFQAQVKRWGKNNCQKCYDYVPHVHLERLDRIPKADLIFVGGCGDLSFLSNPNLGTILTELSRRPHQTFLWQVKNPARFKNTTFPSNVIFGTTIETNRYTTRQFSKAPQTYTRYTYLSIHPHKRKSWTMEPIMDFDEDETLGWVKRVDPEVLWIGYDSRNAGLPEPSLEKTLGFIETLRDNGFNVVEKLMREAHA